MGRNKERSSSLKISYRKIKEFNCQQKVFKLLKRDYRTYAFAGTELMLLPRQDTNLFKNKKLKKHWEETFAKQN